MKFILIVNPFSGKKQGLKILEKIQPLFIESDIEIDIIKTDYSGHSENIAREFDITKYNGLLIIGGDGTFHEVINGLLNRSDQKKIPIGIIPAGSGNSFMHDLDLVDPVKAVNLIISNETRLIDVMRLQMGDEIRYGINLIGWGMVTDVGLTAENIRWIGPIRYTLAALFEILFKKSRKAIFKIQDKIIDTKFMFIIGCNSIHVGKGMKMAPKAKINDGLIDVVVVGHEINDDVRIILFVVLNRKKKLDDEDIDVTLPGRPFKVGNLHLTSKTLRKIFEILEKWGFKYMKLQK